MKVHKVVRFVATVAVTACGIYAGNISAYPEHVTCKNCKKSTSR